MMNQYFELHPLILGLFFLGWAPYLYHDVYRRHTICMAFVKSYDQCILLRTLVAQRALWSFLKDVMLIYAWSSCCYWQNSHWLQIGWLGHCWRPLEKPESEWICHPILILACFDGNFLWSKSKPVHSLLRPSFILVVLARISQCWPQHMSQLLFPSKAVGVQHQELQ